MSTVIKRISLSFLVSLMLMLGLSGAVHAQTPIDSACEGVAIAGGDCASDAEAGVSNIIKVALNLFSLIVGIVAVLMVIIGGFKYVISSGDSAGTQSAKNTILFAIIGLVIVAMAQIIVIFVLNRVDPAKSTPTTPPPPLAQFQN